MKLLPTKPNWKREAGCRFIILTLRTCKQNNIKIMVESQHLSFSCDGMSGTHTSLSQKNTFMKFVSIMTL